MKQSKEWLKEQIRDRLQINDSKIPLMHIDVCVTVELPNTSKAFLYTCLTETVWCDEVRELFKVDIEAENMTPTYDEKIAGYLIATKDRLIEKTCEEINTHNMIVVREGEGFKGVSTAKIAEVQAHFYTDQRWPIAI